MPRKKKQEVCDHCQKNPVYGERVLDTPHSDLRDHGYIDRVIYQMRRNHSPEHLPAHGREIEHGHA